MAAPVPAQTTLTNPTTLPRIAITYCTQCRWLLRAAWLQQELLSTFGTAIGEIALIPSTGGIFQIHLTYLPVSEEGEHARTNEGATETLIWDRKVEQGFPEAKVLKQRVRDCIEPGRGLGHSDTPSSKKVGGGEGKEGGGDGESGKVDLAGAVREKGPSNPLMQRMRPEVAGEGKAGEAEGGEKCEDC